MAEQFDDIYDPSTSDLQSQTLPLDQVIKDAIDAAMLKMHVWLPCKVTEVVNNSVVNVQPLLKRVYTTGKSVDLPIIQNVMVCEPRGADYSIKMPIAVGDTGVALFCDRSLDVWASDSSGLSTVDPLDSRSHDLSDAIFIPGLYTIPNPVAGNADDMILTNGKAQFLLKKPGTFKISNESTELLDLLTQTLTQLVAATTNTVFGPQPLNNFAQFQQILTKLQTLKG